MLFGKDRCRHQHGDLFAVHDGLEGRADGDLGLAEPHVAAEEAFHGLGVFHVAFNLDDGPRLVRGLFVLEGVLELFLPMGVCRIGMAFAGTDILKYFFMMKPPYNISTINQEAALVRLRDAGSVNIQKDTIIAERKRLEKKLEALPVVEKIFPSDSNFLLVKFRDADMIYNSLLERNIIVRNKSREIEGCLRITAGTRTENERLLNELEQLAL